MSRRYQPVCDTCGLSPCECNLNSRRDIGRREAAHHFTSVLINGQFEPDDEPSIADLLLEHRLSQLLPKAG
jgi:hypothetical protein